MSPETFEVLLAPNLRSVRKLVYTRPKSSGEAEDVMQEILLRAFAGRHQLRAHSKFRTWLWSIALKEICSWFRRQRGLLSLDEFPDLVARYMVVSPLPALEQISAREWILVCCAGLAERDRAAIRFKSLREVAAALHSSESATKTAHFRARQRLARIVRVSARRPPGHTACASIQK